MTVVFAPFSEEVILTSFPDFCGANSRGELECRYGAILGGRHESFTLGFGVDQLSNGASSFLVSAQLYELGVNFEELSLVVQSNVTIGLDLCMSMTFETQALCGNGPTLYCVEALYSGQSQPIIEAAFASGMTPAFSCATANCVPVDENTFFFPVNSKRCVRFICGFFFGGE